MRRNRNIDWVRPHLRQTLKKSQIIQENTRAKIRARKERTNENKRGYGACLLVTQQNLTLLASLMWLRVKNHK